MWYNLVMNDRQTKKKHAGGRPTRYKQEYCEMARKLCLLGYTNPELADFFKVATSTIVKWKKDHQEFSTAIMSGRENADAEVAVSSYQRANGYTITTMKPIPVAQGKGMPTIVEQHPVETHVPGDSRMQQFWLMNRQRDKWTETKKVEISGEITTVMTKEQRHKRLKELEKKREARKKNVDRS